MQALFVFITLTSESEPPSGIPICHSYMPFGKK